MENLSRILRNQLYLQFALSQKGLDVIIDFAMDWVTLWRPIWYTGCCLRKSYIRLRDIPIYFLDKIDVHVSLPMFGGKSSSYSFFRTEMISSSNIIFLSLYSLFVKPYISSLFHSMEFYWVACQSYHLYCSYKGKEYFFENAKTCRKSEKSEAKAKGIL